MDAYSIDYLTRMNSRSDDSGSDGSYRRTPSPTNRSHSPSNKDAHSSASDDVQSIAQVLLSLDKSSASSTDDDRKRPHSYIALISMAILSDPDKKMLLGDIYQYIMDNFPYYSNRSRVWKNSIRQNLSINECFIKNGRAENGKGYFLSIHEACSEDFAKGDFRRRQARRRARHSKDRNVSTLPMENRYNIGYVPMSSTPIGYSPYMTSLHFPLGYGSHHAQPGMTAHPQLSPAIYGHVNSTSFGSSTPLALAYHWSAATPDGFTTPVSLPTYSSWQ